MKGTTGRPASRIRRLATSLSIAIAEPVTAEPTNGTSANSSAPCTVPSSPFGPCRTGNTTSKRAMALPPGSSLSHRTKPPRPPGISAICGAASGMVSAAAPAPAPLPASQIWQRPSFAMPIKETSYRSGFRARRMLAAEALETSCSAERPPNNSPTVILRRSQTIIPPCVLIAGLTFSEHRPDFIPQFDPDAIPAHDDALLNDRKGIIPGPVDHQARRELGEHEGEDDGHPAQDSRLRRIRRCRREFDLHPLGEAHQQRPGSDRK